LRKLTFAAAVRFRATLRKILKKKPLFDNRYCFLALPCFGPIFIVFGCVIPHRANQRDVVRSFNLSDRFSLD
jgi:hypothetical protein